ncbi:TetR/AcrR family transcriptional regulator [soil metagenome]
MSKGEDTRARILDEAMNQVSVRGMAGVSLGDLATALGLSKSGVLKHFQSMEALQDALIDTMQDTFRAAIWDPAEPLSPGRARLDEIFERNLDWSDGKSVAGGCPLIATTIELDDQPGPLRDKLKAGQILWARTLAREFAALRPGIDPDTAAAMAFQYKGIIMAHGHSRRMLDDEAARKQARSAYCLLVGAA